MTTRESTIKALQAYRNSHGQPAVRKLFQSVAGVDSFSEVPDDKLAELERAAREGTDDESGADMLDENGGLNVSAIYGKWNSSARRRTED